ncbi:MAG: SDR family oxidoreductase [Desulfotignum sp.]|nr:SDR family oxidoreductase [Desulfotignum sp.]MCF8137485.1 SDR family oxidoreductase [Desulfotignum sp.]
MGSFEDRVVLIESVGDDIAYAIARKVASKGAKLALLDIDGKNTSDIVARLKEDGIEALGVTGDPADCTGVKQAIGVIMEKYGKIDVLINNSDYFVENDIVETKAQGWYQGAKNNIDPAFFLCREVIPIMRKQSYGRIVNIGSIEYLGLPQTSVYSAAKSSMLGFTRSLALETAKDKITVNWVVKGTIHKSNMSQEQEEKMAAKIPVQKLGTPGDVAGAVTFFAADTSKFITGQTFFVCGGKSLSFSMSI